MSQIEIALIVTACLIPVVGLVLILPRRLKRAKKAKEAPKTEPYVPTQAPIEEKPAIKNVKLPSSEINDDELKNYLNQKKDGLTHPVRSDYINPLTESYTPRFDIPAFKQEQTLAEQIKNLSPELKAILFSGALNKKDYDD